MDRETRASLHPVDGDTPVSLHPVWRDMGMERHGRVSITPMSLHPLIEMIVQWLSGTVVLASVTESGGRWWKAEDERS